MNTRARELGCTNTTFINANGLDGEGQKTLTSARDLALISCELLRPENTGYTGIWMDTVRGVNSVWRTRTRCSKAIRV